MMHPITNEDYDRMNEFKVFVMRLHDHLLSLDPPIRSVRLRVPSRYRHLWDVRVDSVGYYFLWYPVVFVEETPHA